MRNIEVYPITRDEILQALARCLEDWQKKEELACGDITGAAIQEAISMIKSPKVNVRIDSIADPGTEGEMHHSSYGVVDRVELEDDLSITAVINNVVKNAYLGYA